jgi:hypothetical protein
VGTCDVGLLKNVELSVYFQMAFVVLEQTKLSAFQFFSISWRLVLPQADFLFFLPGMQWPGKLI